MLYIMLGTVTDEGQQQMLANPNMFSEVCNEINVKGAQLLARYAVLGRYDYVLMVEAEDVEAVARLSMDLGARARMHIETLQAISADMARLPRETLSTHGVFTEGDPPPES